MYFLLQQVHFIWFFVFEKIPTVIFLQMFNKLDLKVYFKVISYLA